MEADSIRRLRGVARIAATFERLRNQRRTGLIPYLTVGHPTLEATPELVQAVVDAGADIVELGAPFSDPVADGTTIQRSSQIALQQGASLRSAFAIVAELRSRGIDVPVLVMPYFNTVLRYGVEASVADAAAMGADGFIVPDLPFEEADELLAACRKMGLASVFLLAPTSTDERIKAICKAASGFIYCVSLTGVTGARSELSADLPAFLRRVRAACPPGAELPLAVGFGISRAEHVRQVGELADAAVVGSAVIDCIERAGVERAPTALREYIRSLRGV